MSGSYVLTSSGSSVSNPVTPTQGGTGVSNPTAHSIPVAEGASNYNFVGPGTTGQILQAVTSADPAYSTATYPATTTANQLLYSSATNTVGGLTSANAGVLVTSASGVPSIATTTIPGSYIDFNNTTSGWYNPLQECILRDDFVCSTRNDPYGDLGWTKFAVATGVLNFGLANDSGHPGLVILQTGTNSGGAMDFYLGNSSNTGGNFLVGGGVIDAYFVIQIPVLSNGTDRFLFSIGFANDDLVTFPTAESCIMFEYSDNVNSGNWRLRTTNNGVGNTTTSNTSTAVGTGWTTLRININAAGTLCTFYVAGVSVGTIATNIPTLGVSPHLTLVKTAGTTNVVVNFDLFYLYQYLTNPR